MNNQNNLLSIWSNRMESLQEILNVLSNRLRDDTNPRSQVVYHAVQKLAQFGQQHFQFFYNGFTNSHRLEGIPSFQPVSALENDEEFGAYYLPYGIENYILGTIVGKIAADISVFRRQTEALKVSWGNEQTVILDAIDGADNAAASALQIFVELKMAPEDARVFTYTQKVPQARVIPYAPLVIVGIPQTTISTDEDYLAIPHEVGHYLYWYGHAPQQPECKLRDLLKAKLDDMVRDGSLDAWVIRWRQEIFCDVVSCLIAGPIAADSFQHLMQYMIGEYFWHDNGTHPPAVTRPYIYEYVLSRMGNISSSIQESLSANWTSIVQDRTYNQEPPILIAQIPATPLYSPEFVSNKRSSQTLEHVKSQILCVAKEIMGILLPYMQDRYTPWSSNEADDVSTLKENFHQMVEAWKTQQLLDLSNNSSWFADDDSAFAWCEVAEEYGYSPATEHYEYSTWSQIFRLGGWADGPTGSPNWGGGG